MTYKRVVAGLAMGIFMSVVGSSANAVGIVTVGGELSLVAPPSSFHSSSFSGIITPTPIIFSEFVDYPIPIFSETDPANPFLAPTHTSASIFDGLDYLPLDITTPGTYPSDYFVGGDIPSGTHVSTYIVHYEPSDTNPVGSASGSVTFDSDILGIQLGSDTLGLFRELLFEGPNISLYGSSGFEICGSDPDPTMCDTVTLSSDRRTLSFTSNVNGATDDLRIFFGVAEPPTFSLFAAGFIILGFASWRMRRNSSAP
jgi:hypothetical protein